MDDLRHSYALDGLRGLAAYIVVLSHFPPQQWLLNGFFWKGAGHIGVVLFFVLSGFLMSKLYLSSPLTKSKFRSFAVKRISRVAPLYLAVVIISLAFSYWLQDKTPFYDISSENLFPHLTFQKGVSVLWTIPVEVQFYALFPLLWLSFAKFGNSFFAITTIMLISVVLFGYPTAPVLLSYLPFFLIGVLAAFIKLESNMLTEICFVFLIFFFFISLPVPRTWLGFAPVGTWKSPMYMFLIPSLLLTTLYSKVALKVLGNRIMVYLGNISYSVYLLHIPVLIYIVKFTDLDKSNPYFFLAFIIGSTLAGTASFYCFETPVKDAINRKFTKKKIVSA